MATAPRNDREATLRAGINTELSNALVSSANLAKMSLSKLAPEAAQDAFYGALHQFREQLAGIVTNWLPRYSLESQHLLRDVQEWIGAPDYNGRTAEWMIRVCGGDLSKRRFWDLPQCMMPWGDAIPRDSEPLAKLTAMVIQQEQNVMLNYLQSAINQSLLVGDLDRENGGTQLESGVREGGSASDSRERNLTSESSWSSPEIPHVNGANKSLTPVEERGRYRVAKILQAEEEIEYLRPHMNSDEDYDRLKAAHPEYIAIKAAERDPELKILLLGIKGHHHKKAQRFAKQIAASECNVKLNTIEKAWDLYKPEARRIGRSAREPRWQNTPQE